MKYLGILTVTWLLMFVLTLHIQQGNEDSLQSLNCGDSICNKMEIQKSPIDDNRYLVYKLPNKAKLLVMLSPKQTTMSNFALRIGIGSTYDPSGFDGLAHLLQHMIFMGNKEYPLQNEFEKYIKFHSGTYNAQTTQSHTAYYFDIEKTSLKEGIKRMISSIKEPLLKASSISKQIYAVNEEYQLLRNNPNWQEWIAFKRIFGIGGFKQFSPGNLKSLNHSAELIAHHLKQFHSKYYSSDIMIASVAIKQFQKDLLQSVVDQLLSIKNNNIRDQIKYKQNILQIQGNQHILINHTLPNHNSFAIMAFPYINQGEKMLIGDDSNILDYYKEYLKRKGGLIEYLKQKYDDIHDITVEIGTIAQLYYPYIQTTIQMVNDQQDNIIVAKQGYSIISHTINHLSIFPECITQINKQENTEFNLLKYKNSKTYEYLISLMGLISIYDSNTFLKDAFVIRQNQKSLLWKTIIVERKSNAIHIIDNITTFIEQYLSVPYEKKTIIISEDESETHISKFNQFTFNLDKCVKNPYSSIIKSDFTSPYSQTGEPQNPQWLSDQYGNMIFADITSQVIEGNSIILAIHYHINTEPIIPMMMNVVLGIDQQVIRESEFALSVMKKIQIIGDPQYGVIGVKCIGPIDAIYHYLDFLLKKIKGLANTSEAHYKKAVQKLTKSKQAYYIMKKPWEVSEETLGRIFYPTLKSVDYQITIIRQYDLISYRKEVQNLLKDVRITWGIIGPKKQKYNIAKKIKGKQMQFFNTQFYEDLQVKNTELKKVKCRKGILNIALKQQKPSFISYYISCGPKTIKNLIIVKMMGQYADEPFFNLIRTNKKMAYAVFVQPIQISTSGYGLYFFIASSNSKSITLRNQIQNFVQTFFKDITEQQFANLKKRVTQNLFKPYDSSQQLTTFIWRILRSRKFYDTDKLKWKQLYKQQGSKLTLQQYNNFVKNVINKREPIIIQYTWGQKQEQSNNSIYNNLQQFKNNQCQTYQQKLQI